MINLHTILLLLGGGGLKENVIVKKSLDFAVRVVNLYKYLYDERKEYVMSKQLLRSGTSVGANVREAVNAQSKRDFVAKMNISLKEAAETEYWLELLRKTDYLNQLEYDEINRDCDELKRLLVSIIKTSNQRKTN
jgi:four helix bundle protein